MTGGLGRWIDCAIAGSQETQSLFDDLRQMKVPGLIQIGPGPFFFRPQDHHVDGGFISARRSHL